MITFINELIAFLKGKYTFTVERGSRNYTKVTFMEGKIVIFNRSNGVTINAVGFSSDQNLTLSTVEDLFISKDDELFNEMAGYYKSRVLRPSTFWKTIEPFKINQEDIEYEK
jgi:hypothetical protein